MSTAPKQSLFADGTKPADRKPPAFEDFQNRGIAHAPNADNLNPTNRCRVELLKIKVEDVPDGFVSGFLHLPANYATGTLTSPNQTAAILLSGAGGGVVGPSGVYLSIADKLANVSRGIPCLRLDY